MADDLPPIPPGVIPVVPDSDPVLRWWREQYSHVVARAGRGGPTALAVTTQWAKDEVEYARAHGVEPEVGVPARPEPEPTEGLTEAEMAELDAQIDRIAAERRAEESDTEA